MSPVSKTYVIGAVLATSPSFLHVRVVLNMVNDKRPLLHKHWFETDRGPDTGVCVQMPLDHPLDRRRPLQETAMTASTRWKNILAPPRHSQLNMIGTCFEITDKYHLGIDMRSLNLPTITPSHPAAPLNLTTSRISAESSPLMVPLLLSDLAC
jgi:hypothetical protein